ncbi:MAG: DegV family protein [Clostridia bacterium]|nr:DegV family protein [Clostridia bacterium]
MSKKVILCADSTCDLSPELIEKYNVHIYPLHVLVGEQNYSDGVDITPDDIYATYHEKGILPKTAAVNTSEYIDFCKPFIDEGNEVIYISLGSALSSSHNNCRIASTELPGLYAIDSRNLSTGSGLLVLEAADRIEKGMSAAEIAEELNEIAGRVSASFVIDTLEFLHKGGRCSALAMLGANMLRLKPSIKVDNTDGSMGVDKKYRGSLEKALEQYVADQLKDRTDIDTRRIFITHSGISEERIELVHSLVKEYGDFEEILITRAGCTISSHCGPNTLGVLFITKP